MKARIIYVPLIRKYIPQVYDEKYKCWGGVEVPSWWTQGGFDTWHAHQTKYCAHKNQSSAMKALKEYLDFVINRKRKTLLDESLHKDSAPYFEVVEEFSSGEDNSS